MGKTLNDVSESLLDELAAEINSVEVLREDDVTVERLSQRTPGRKRVFAERILKEKVRAGELICVPCYNPETGRQINAYRKKP